MALDVKAEHVLFCVTFLAVFALLANSMPSALFFYTPDFYEYDVPDEWSLPKSIVEEARYWGNTTVDYDPVPVVTFFDLTIEREPLDDIWIRISWTDTITPKRFNIQRAWYYFGPLFHTDNLLPYPLWESDVRENIDESGNFSRWEMHDDKYSYVVYILYNTTNYDTLSQALDDGHIICQIGQGLSGDEAYEDLALSGLDIMGQLLAFRMPTVNMENEDASTVFNGIIAIPLWITIGILIFAIIMTIVKALPFT